MDKMGVHKSIKNIIDLKKVDGSIEENIKILEEESEWMRDLIVDYEDLINFNESLINHLKAIKESDGNNLEELIEELKSTYEWWRS